MTGGKREPLKKIVRQEHEAKPFGRSFHVLECGHKVRAYADEKPKRRRCPECPKVKPQSRQGKCIKCKVRFVWHGRGMTVSRARCPRCGLALYATTYLLDYPAVEMAAGGPDGERPLTKAEVFSKWPDWPNASPAMKWQGLR